MLRVLPKDLTKKDYNQYHMFNTNLGGGSNFTSLPPVGFHLITQER